MRQKDYHRAWATIGIIVVVITILSLIGCTGMGVGLPANRAYFRFTNRTDVPFRLLLADARRPVERDGTTVYVRRIYDKGVLPPGKSMFFQWVFAAEMGRWAVVVGSDTTWSPDVLPWTKKDWHVAVWSDGFTVTHP